MFREKFPRLKTVAFVGGGALLIGILSTPFLPLSPFWHQAMVGVVLIGHLLALLARAYLFRGCLADLNDAKDAEAKRLHIRWLPLTPALKKPEPPEKALN